MASGLTFKSVSKKNLAWHSDLGGDRREWLYIDGLTDNGYMYSLVLASKMEMGENIVGPEKGDWPLVDCLVTSPEGVTHHVSKAFPIETLKLEPWGVTIGDNVFTGSLTPDGKPAGYRIKVALDDAGIDITAKAVATGMQFVEEEHGYMYYDPTTNIGAGWWPLVPRAEIEGTLTFQGKTIPVKGLGYCEREVGNQSFGGWISHWFWGHFYAGDYTAIWADVVTHEIMQYRHFSPFVLWKGSDVILSTHNLALGAEKLELDAVIGMPYPTAETVHATEGNTEFWALILPPTIVERDLMVNNPGTSPENPGCYFRLRSDIDIEIRRWDRLEQIRGRGIHEYGWMTRWFPVPGR